LQPGPHLVVEEQGLVRVVPLDAERLTIGQAPTSDVVLTSGWAAVEGLRIERIGGAHRVVVAGAASDVLLRGEPVRDQMLHDGDVVRLADPTTGAFISLAYVNPLAPPIARIQHFATPPGQARRTIGRADAEILLDQPLVDRHHADLLWRDGGHVLHDLGSTYGTFVNGQRVVGERSLAPGDVVQIGTFRLTYDGDSFDTLDQRRAIRLDATSLRRVVGSGDRRRVILHDTTISIEPCEFVALVGGSGAGKSTLLMALCGFAPADAGRITINGDDFYASPDAYRSLLGYVPQDDILHRALTVERALRYAAELRLPPDTTAEEIDRRISRALEAVDMAAHRDKRVDQLSGGQRKRVSIASETLAEPSLIFLDEPTSGLDPGLERRMMYTLRRLADAGHTVVLVTHATANIRQCDHIAFMAEGRMVWFGPPAQALEFFGVDDFADIYSKSEGRADPASALVRDELAVEHAQWSSEHPGAEPPPLAELWRRKFACSLQHQKYTVERLCRAPAASTMSTAHERPTGASATARSALRQLGILVRRYVELMLRDRKNLALLLLQAPMIGLLLYLVTTPDSLTSRLDAKKLTFVLATVGVWFGVINSAREICKESAILRRERLAGLRVGPYLLSKVAVLFALVVIQTALLYAVLAIRVRMPEEGLLLPASLELMTTSVLGGLAGIALGLCVSVVASTPDKATSLIPIVLVPQVLFAGLMFRLEGVAEVLSWLTASRWAMDAMGAIVRVNELRSVIRLTYEPQYVATPSNLAHAWSMLGVHVLVWGAIAWLVLHRRRA
jgi:ABC-type multidrug transport system ATPase subunit